MSTQSPPASGYEDHLNHRPSQTIRNFADRVKASNQQMSHNSDSAFKLADKLADRHVDRHADKQTEKQADKKGKQAKRDKYSTRILSQENDI